MKVELKEYKGLEDVWNGPKETRAIRRLYCRINPELSSDKEQ